MKKRNEFQKRNEYREKLTEIQQILDSIDLLRLATYSEELNLCTIFMLDEIKYMPLQEALVKVDAINVERLSIRELINRDLIKHEKTL